MFIYDNAPSYSAIQNTLLTQHVRNIITTRNQDVPDESSAYNLTLDVFSPQEAERFIKKRITMPAAMPLATYNEHVKALAQKLEYHPLAIALACGYMKDEDIDELNGDEPIGMNLKIFLDRFDQLFQKLAHYERHGTYPTSLYIALKMSLSKLTDSDRDIFFRLCYLIPDHVPVRFLGRYERLRKPCLTLAKHSLITAITDETSRIKTVSMHRLVQDIGRMIHVQDTDLQSPEHPLHVQTLFNEQMQTLEHQALSYHETFHQQKGDTEELKQLYEDVTRLKDHWLTFIKHMQAHEGLMPIDVEAHYLRILQSKIADKLLTLRPDHENVILKRQTKLNDADFQRLQTIYQDHFAHITNLEHKKMIYVKLAKFYNGDFTKYLDWSFFDGTDIDATKAILDIFISMNTLDNHTLKKTCDAAVGSNPYHCLLAARCKQERNGGNPYVLDEVIKFVEKLCTKNVGTSFHRDQNAINLWAQLSQTQCQILEQLPTYDENVLITLTQFDHPGFQPRLNLYINLSLTLFQGRNDSNEDFAIGALRDGEEAALLVRGFQYFYDMLCQFSRLFNSPLMADIKYIESVIFQKPSLQHVIPYLRKLCETARIGEDATQAEILQVFYWDNPTDRLSKLGKGYFSFMADMLKPLTYTQNRMIAFSALFKHYALLKKDLPLGETKNGADDESLLDALSRMQNLIHDSKFMTMLQNKTAEFLGISTVQLAPDASEEATQKKQHAPFRIAGMPAHKAYTLLDIVDRVGDQLHPLLDQIDSHALPLETTYDRIQVASILYDLTQNTQTQDAQTHKRAILLEHLKNLMHFGYTVQQVPHLLFFYMKHHSDLLALDTQRFATIPQNFKPDNDGDLMILGKALPFIAQDRLNAVMKHPFLMPPLSICPFAHMIAMAARMDNQLWKQWIANPMNFEAYTQYMQTVMMSLI